MNHDEARRAVTLVRSFFPRMEVNEDVIDAWEVMLGKYDFSDVKSSVISFMEGHRFMPNCADIKREIDEHCYSVDIDSSHKRYNVRTLSKGILPFPVSTQEEATMIRSWLESRPPISEIEKEFYDRHKKKLVNLDEYIESSIEEAGTYVSWDEIDRMTK